MYIANLKMKILSVRLGYVHVHVELSVGVSLLLRYKFWTCCQRRTSDFDEFLRQEGCTTGEHMWIEVHTVVVIMYSPLTRTAVKGDLYHTFFFLQTEKKETSCRYDTIPMYMYYVLYGGKCLRWIHVSFSYFLWIA